MRKLASIQRIIDLQPIEGADLIERATVLGWELVVKKGEFNIGDLVVYCEIDSILPDKPEFEFLKPRGFRIRTIRLKKQISQGICFPLSIIPTPYILEEDNDVTDLIGVIKWEPTMPACLSGVAKSTFPSFIPKTDETRVQNLQRQLRDNKGMECYVTEKLDGSSMTVYINNGVFGVCSRNLDLLEDENNSYWKVARALDLERKLREFCENEKGECFKNIALQGELIGESIQGNKYAIKGQDFRLFSVYDIDNRLYFNIYALQYLSSYLGLTIAPILSMNYILGDDIKTIVESSIIKSTLNQNQWAEGIVIRSLNGASELSFKAINPEFLLKHGE